MFGRAIRWTERGFVRVERAGGGASREAGLPGELAGYGAVRNSFANDWADDLAIKTSAAVPANTWLPATAGLTPAANLNALTVTAIGGATVTVNTGATAPAGGGFEVRTRDFSFMPGEDPGLVLRGSQQNLTFTRASAADRFYVRMFDGASPPNYSEFSAAIFINLPLGL